MILPNKFLTIIGLILLFAFAQNVLSLTLVKNGNPKATIILSEKPTRAAQFAALEIQHHIREMTGVEIPIIRGAKQVDGVKIFVGDNPEVGKRGYKTGEFAKQEYLLDFNDDSIVLLGRDKQDYGQVKYDRQVWETFSSPSSKPEGKAAGKLVHSRVTWPSIWDEQGTLYAVYDFLENNLGVCWFTPTDFGTIIPRRKDLKVTGKKVRRRPFCKMRNGTGMDGNIESYDGGTSLWPRNSTEFKKYEETAYPKLHKRFPKAYNLAKRNMIHLFLLRRRAGGTKALCNHSLYDYYERFWEPQKGRRKFEGKRPDFFAKGYPGKPKQLCYTNPDVIKQIVADARDYFDNGGYPNPPGCGHHVGYMWGEDFFALEPNDCGGFCKCEKCRALYMSSKKDEHPYFSRGQDSEYHFTVVNKVAKELKKSHPNKHLITLAYGSHAYLPKNIKLEDNVAVQFCFSNNRMVGNKQEYQHEVKLLNEWAELDNPLYLWLYYTFPAEVARGWYCFPGFFAHTIGDQFKLFKEKNIQGIFHCGYGQDVEAYLTFKLMDNPDLDVDELLNDYFNKLYGPAGKYLKQFYLDAEKIYSDTSLYPAEHVGHQTEEIAWGFLGKKQRMEHLEKLVEKAKVAVKLNGEKLSEQEREQLELAKNRVDLFVKSTWDYMKAGKEKFQRRKRAWRGGLPRLRGLLTTGSVANGDPAKIDWTEATPLNAALTWESNFGEGSQRDIEGRLVHDGKFLYLRLKEDFNDSSFKKNEKNGDHFQLIFAGKRAYPYRELLIDQKGNCSGKSWNSPNDKQGQTWDSKAKIISRKTDKSWTVLISLPLTQLTENGLVPGKSLFMNIARRSKNGNDEPVWVPTFGPFNTLTRLGEILLDTKEDTIPAVKVEALSDRGLVKEWKFSSMPGKPINDPELVAGPFGNALVLNNGRKRARQYLDCGNDKKYDLRKALTLEAWVKTKPYKKGSMGGYPAIMGRGYADGSYSLHIRPGYTLWFELDSEKRFIFNPKNLTLSPGWWDHVVATWNGKKMRVFINGRELEKGKPMTETLRKVDIPLRIGWLGSWNFFNGEMDNIRIYNRGMDVEEVWARYKKGHQKVRECSKK